MKKCLLFEETPPTPLTLWTSMKTSFIISSFFTSWGFLLKNSNFFATPSLSFCGFLRLPLPYDLTIFFIKDVIFQEPVPRHLRIQEIKEKNLTLSSISDQPI